MNATNAMNVMNATNAMNAMNATDTVFPHTSFHDSMLKE